MDGGLRHCTGDGNQEHPQEKEIQKIKMFVSEGITNSCEKKRSQKQGVKKRYTYLNTVPNNSKER